MIDLLRETTTFPSCSFPSFIKNISYETSSTLCEKREREGSKREKRGDRPCQGWSQELEREQKGREKLNRAKSWKRMGTEECRKMRAIKSVSLIRGNFCWARQRTHAVRKLSKTNDQILMCGKCCLSLLSPSGMYFLPLPTGI